MDCEAAGLLHPPRVLLAEEEEEERGQSAF